MAKNKNHTTYEIVNKKILEALENGCIPWTKPWEEVKGKIPISFSTNKIYKGANWWLLLLESFKKGYDSPYWATFNQIRKAEGKVLKGQKATKIIYWNFIEVVKNDLDGNPIIDKESGKPELKKVGYLKYYNVYNICQTEGVKEIPTQPEIKVSQCSEIVQGYISCPEIIHAEQNRAYYSKQKDYINLPKSDLFNSEDEYFSTLFHEMVHSTGHENRLNRQELYKIASFGDKNYSKEELTAELGAAYLCFQAGISPKTITNSSSYLESWLKGLNEDKGFLILAMGKAQKAADYILNRNSDCEKQSE